MSIKYIRCTRCGGDLTKKGEAYVCQYCNAAFVEDFISQNEKIIEQFLDELKLEKVSALRQQLYEKTHAKYLSRNEILETAKGIRSYLPEDFLARFYESACSKNKQDVIDFIQSIDYELEYPNLDLVIEFMVKNLNSENLLAVSNLIENTYKDNCIELYSKFTNAYEKEAEKIDKGIYERIIPRDVFVAYSSKDMKVVEEITQYLESQGISCFVALRNLRHGVGAVEDYDKALEEAIDNCKIFLFVSSKNSRNMACDALKKEITYVKRIDLKDAPIQYKNNYVKLPKKYKKPRIQLRLDNVETRIADRIVNEFFDGYEWCYDKDAIIDRISDIMFNFETDTEEQEEQKKLEDDLKKQQEELKKKEEEIQKSKNKKYCVNCQRELPIEAKFCIDCGSSEFANSVKELFEIIESKKKSKEKHYCINCLKPVDIDVNICSDCKGTEFEKDFNVAITKYKKIQEQKIIAEKKKVENDLTKKQEEVKIKQQPVSEKVKEEPVKKQVEVKTEQEVVDKKKEELAKQKEALLKKEEDKKKKQEEEKRKREELKKQQEALIKQQKEEFDKRVKILEQCKKGDIVEFGSFPQTLVGKDFKEEPIKWKVLDAKNNEVFLLSEQILEAHKYDEKSNNYAKSEIRKWLNEDFYNQAFNEDEKQIILTTEVDNSVESTLFKKNRYACENTNDKVFLLSAKEASSKEYGLDKEDVRQKKGTDYAISHGMFVKEDTGNGYWCLRSPNNDGREYSKYVYNSGSIGFNYISSPRSGVVPAIKVHVNNENKNATKETSKPTKTSSKTDNSKSKKEDSPYKKGSIIEFGTYPQTKIRDTFKVEPIKWKILDIKNNEAFLLSEKVLDTADYDRKSNNYANSEIRKWLNEDFYNKAFNDKEKSKILTTEVDNSAESTLATYNPSVCENTNDKVFLLSRKELSIKELGLVEYKFRIKAGTDYAKAQSLFVCNINNKCFWWLRSPSFSSSSRLLVKHDGIVEARNINTAIYGVVPAIKIKLS